MKLICCLSAVVIAALSVSCSTESEVEVDPIAQLAEVKEWDARYKVWLRENEEFNRLFHEVLMNQSHESTERWRTVNLFFHKVQTEIGAHPCERALGRLMDIHYRTGPVNPGV